jgi:hypothetical protein
MIVMIVFKEKFFRIKNKNKKAQKIWAIKNPTEVGSNTYDRDYK